MRFVYTVYQKFGWVKKKKRLRDIFEELCFIFLRPIKPVSIPFEIINIVQKIRFKMKNGTLRNQQQVFFFSSTDTLLNLQLLKKIKAIQLSLVNTLIRLPSLECHLGQTPRMLRIDSKTKLPVYRAI